MDRETPTEANEMGLRYRIALQTSMDGFAVVGPGGEFLEVNDALCSMSRSSHAEMLTGHLTDFAVPPPGISVPERMAEIVRAGSGRFEGGWRCRDGALLDVEVSITTAVVGGDTLFFAFLRDITERVEARKELSESERRFRLIAENSNDVIWLLDVATRRLTYVSPSVFQLRGFTPAEVMSRPAEAALTPDSARAMDAVFNARIRAVEGGDESQRTDVSEGIQPRRDGTTVETEIVTTLVSDSSGKVVQILGVTRDISVRRRAEKRLREREERFRALFETIPLGVVYRDAFGEVVAANPAAERIIGLTLDEMRGRPSLEPDLEFFREDGSPLPRKEYPPIVALRTGALFQNWILGFQARGRDGITWVEGNAIPQFRPGEASPFRVLTTFRDVTEERKTASQLRLKEAALASSINAMTLASLDGSLTYANDAFLKYWGYGSLSEVRGRPVVDFWRDPAASAAPMAQVLEGKSWIGEMVAKRKDGSFFDARVLGTMVKAPDGQPLCLVGSVIDISDLKRAEAELSREMERMREALASAQGAPSLGGVPGPLGGVPGRSGTGG